MLRDPAFFQSRRHKLKQFYRHATSSVIQYNSSARIVSRLLAVPPAAPIHVEADHAFAIESSGAEFQVNTIALHALLKLFFSHLQTDLVVRECIEKALVKRMKVCCGQ